MGLENRRSGNVSEGSNPSLSAISPENQPESASDVSRGSRSVPTEHDGGEWGTPRPIYVQFTTHGGNTHIRQWASKPFDGGVEYAPVDGRPSTTPTDNSRHAERTDDEY